VLNVEVPNVGGVKKHRLFGFGFELDSSTREVESAFTSRFVLFVPFAVCTAGRGFGAARRI
jgi:hypothetical protein